MRARPPTPAPRPAPAASPVAGDTARTCPVGAGNSAVVVDLQRCQPMLNPRVPNLVPISGITGSAHCAVRPLEGSDSRAVRGSLGQGSPRSVFRKADPESLDRHAGLCVPGPCSRGRRQLRRYAGRRRRRLHATHGTQDRERRTCSARHDRVRPPTQDVAHHAWSAQTTAFSGPHTLFRHVEPESVTSHPRYKRLDQTLRTKWECTLGPAAKSRPGSRRRSGAEPVRHLEASKPASLARRVGQG